MFQQGGCCCEETEQIVLLLWVRWVSNGPRSLNEEAGNYSRLSPQGTKKRTRDSRLAFLGHIMSTELFTVRDLEWFGLLLSNAPIHSIHAHVVGLH